ncbi:NINE protein [Flavihumibacter fluvii]|uniref:NINE protein n=1 Tax=Flavihumibacter fluvii TaxID=2838157 RepID=UPI001BDE0DA9|nr:NINE protein [Flavihumibacter fluvii]ULQ51503.1 NINE protein [Flavihumibacter fluvii]
MNNYLMGMPDLQPEELAGIRELTANMSESQQAQFFMLYTGKRKKPQEILLLTCLGFVVVAGIQRFVIGQVGMGVLYLLTGGLCLVGTIVDVVNYKRLATDYNLTQMYESSRMVGA